MKLKSISLYGFRNLKKTQLTFPPDVNVFALIGPNGHGKTNFLESIFLLGLTKSFRTRENNDLIAFDLDFCRIQGEIDKKGDCAELTFVVTEQPAKKTLKLNDVIKTASDFIGTFNVVFFSPDDMGMIHGSPSLRRRYLDVMISQLDHDYLENLLIYQKIIKQRNALLKQIADKKAKPEDLDYWDESVASHGRKIVEIRSAVIKKIEKKVKKLYMEISGTKDNLKVFYKPSADMDRFEDLLVAHRDSDIASGNSNIGPHRDDLAFMLNDHDIASFGSRGEWRSLILALKFAEIDMLESKTGMSPVLLLDDVFSELDEKRQKYLFDAIANTQTFISTTHPEFVEGFKGKKLVYSVKEGDIIVL